MLGHEVVLATVRDFADRSGTSHVTVILEGSEGAILIEGEPGEPLIINDEHLVLDGEFSNTLPLPLQLPKPLPPTALEVDARTGEIAAPIGAVGALADAVAALAQALGGRTAAVAEFATAKGEALTLAARPGEPVVAAIGDEQFELP